MMPPTPDGPRPVLPRSREGLGLNVLRGWWQDESVARRKFTAWVGEHGDRPHALITLTDEETHVTLKQWPDTA
jgi:hypothetical protein